MPIEESNIFKAELRINENDQFVCMYPTRQSVSSAAAADGFEIMAYK